jgi:adsorption protein B
VWILLSGLDDVFINFACLFSWRRRFRWPAASDLDSAPERRIAVLLPLWREDGVIERMLDRNLAAIRYRDYEIFAGVYANDAPTVRAVYQVARRDSRVHLAVCSQDGPTSKADCLNYAWRRMRSFESAHVFRFDLVVLHDAEDLVHPEELRLINCISQDYEMVQIPVLPLPTRPGDLTHGVYCDEFAEYQSKDIPVRQFLGGFLPSNGVGTGFDRVSLDRLAEQRHGRVFEPESLTEDYETGYCLHAMGCRQAFVPLRMDAAGPVATREYFPRDFRAAVRQRSRWVAGIALQGWERHGWRVPWPQAYWFWRDRKGLAGNLLTPAANLVFAYGLASYLVAAGSGHVWYLGSRIPAGLGAVYSATLAISVVQAAARVRSSARVYGWRFASGVPVRMVWANAVNCAATVSALAQFIAARLRRRTIEWRKTEHVYPPRPVPGYSPVTFSEPM